MKILDLILFGYSRTNMDLGGPSHFDLLMNSFKRAACVQ